MNRGGGSHGAGSTLGSERNDAMTHDEYTALVAEGRYSELPGPRVPKGTVFENENGTIENVLLRPATSFAVIRSKKGAIRANHWHRTDWHYIHVISGAIMYFEDEVVDQFLPGETVFTGPATRHAILSMEDGVFVTMSLRVRSHEAHELDVVRQEILSRSEADKLVAAWDASR